jgi:pimeloyl-ACP methyl ester carboxylesterase
VFVHGWRLNGSVEASDMEPAFKSRGGWRRPYITLPGMGKSEPDPNIIDMNDYLNLLVEFVNNIAPMGGFAIAGTSAGAGLARGVAHLLAERVRGVLLRVPMLDDLRRLQFASDSERDQYLDQPPEDPWMPTAFRIESKEKLESLWRPARELADRQTSVTDIRNDSTRYVLRGDFDTVLTAPSLIVAGRQDSRVGYSDAVSVMTQFPRATVAILDRAGHLMPTGDRTLFDALIQDWLDRMEEMWV